MPRANATPSGPTSSTPSPARNSASQPVTPTASRLAPPSTTARCAPASTLIRAVDALAVAEPELERRRRLGRGEARPVARPARMPGQHGVAVAAAITVGMPAPAATSAAETLLSIPPRPSALPGPNTAERAAAPSSISTPSLQHAGHRGEQHEQARAHEHRDLRGERVVVAEADLVGRRRVVLVHDGHRAEREERGERAARVDVGAALARSRCP